jgi:hypothetical protein
MAAAIRENAVPSFLPAVMAPSYPEFLAARRKLMAELIQDYYQRL